jgi:hypothetical protein
MAQAVHQPLSVPGRIPPATAWLKEHLKYFLRRSITRMRVPDRPWFDPDGTRLFETLLQRSQLYMEYGSGGSTVLAAHLGKDFVSVESDLRFSKAVTDRIATGEWSGHVVAVDIGRTGAWGAPLFTRPSEKRLHAWRQYVVAPWRQLPSGSTPDLVLIDGRFRIACALYSLMQMQGREDATILFDDYGDRRNYHVVANFARLERMAGRMAVFHPRNDVAPGELATALDRFMIDWR